MEFLTKKERKKERKIGSSNQMWIKMWITLYPLEIKLFMKTLISKEIARLRKFGFTVYNFNLNKSLPTGIKNFVDHLIISEKYLIFVEVKIGKDKLNPEQIDLMNLISFLGIRNKSIHYQLLSNVKQTKDFVLAVLSKKLK